MIKIETHSLERLVEIAKTTVDPIIDFSCNENNFISKAILKVRSENGVVEHFYKGSGAIDCHIMRKAYEQIKNLSFKPDKSFVLSLFEKELGIKNEDVENRIFKFLFDNCSRLSPYVFQDGSYTVHFVDLVTLYPHTYVTIYKLEGGDLQKPVYFQTVEREGEFITLDLVRPKKEVIQTWEEI